MADLTTVEIRLSAALVALTSDWQICVGQRRCRAGEAVPVAPGDVSVRLSTRIVRDAQRIDVACTFGVTARRDTATVVSVPAHVRRMRF